MWYYDTVYTFRLCPVHSTSWYTIVYILIGMFHSCNIMLLDLSPCPDLCAHVPFVSRKAMHLDHTRYAKLTMVFPVVLAHVRFMAKGTSYAYRLLLSARHNC